MKGAFSHFIHDHFFEQQNDLVLMKDVFDFESPFGLLGKLVDNLFLTNYMKQFLLQRNQTIKVFAESGNWKKILPNQVAG